MPYRDKWSPFDSTLTDDVQWEQAKMRLNKPRRKATRVKTGIASVDQILGGGLPEGLTVVYGPSGAGKSKFCKSVASEFIRRNQKVLYFIGEDTFDAPEPMPPMLNTVDMVTYRPGPEKATKTIIKFIQQMKPDLVIIDSLTTVFGGTTAAVIEKDIREYTGYLAARTSGVVPVLGISEVRGNDKYEAPAGGRGVLHAGLAVLYFGKDIIKDKWMALDYGMTVGNMLWSFYVEKDRDGLANQGKMYRVDYSDNLIFFTPIEGGRRDL